MRLWDADTAQPVGEPMRGHTDVVKSVAFSADGHRLASGSADTTVRLWNLAAGGKVTILNGHTDAVDVVALNPDGTLLASAGADQTVRLWDPRSPKQPPVALQHEDAVLSLDFSEDSQLLASATTGLVRVWTILRPGTQPLSIPDRSVQSFGFSPDGQR